MLCAVFRADADRRRFFLHFNVLLLNLDLQAQRRALRLSGGDAHRGFLIDREAFCFDGNVVQTGSQASELKIALTVGRYDGRLAVRSRGRNRRLEDYCAGRIGDAAA